MNTDNSKTLCHQSWQQIPERCQEAMTLTNLGRIYACRQENLFALACFEAALDLLNDICSTIDVRLEMAILIEQIASLCEHTHHIDLAIAYYLDACNLYQAVNATAPVVRILFCLGALHERLKTVAIALYYYHQALRMAALPHALKQVEPLVISLPVHNLGMVLC